MENLSKLKIDALLAFYNLFSEKLSLEECKNLSDTKYLLHSIINFIETNNLTYQDHSNFGYKETFNYLVKVLNENITSQLNYKLADEYDDYFEIAKILVALFYELRLSKTDDVIEYVEELKPKYNSQIALIISHLDNSSLWDGTPDSWASILKVENFFLNNSTLDDTLEENISPVSTYKLGIDYRRTTNILNAIKTVSSLKNENLNKSEISDSNCFQGSPVSAVINSPRGAELTKLKKLSRQIVEYKENIKLICMERDNFEDLADKLQTKLNEANETINQFERKNNSLRQETERIKYLKKELTDSEKEKYELKRKLEELKIKNYELSNLRNQLRCETESAVNRAEFLAKENESFQTLIDDLNKKRRDEMEINNFTLESLSKSENQLLLAESQWRKKFNDFELQLSSQEKNFISRLEEKEKEFRHNMELSIEVQSNYTMRINELELSLKESNQKNEDIFKIKTELNTSNTALNALKEENQLLIKKLEYFDDALSSSNHNKFNEDKFNQLERKYTLNQNELKVITDEYSDLKKENLAIKNSLVAAQEQNINLYSDLEAKNKLLIESNQLIEKLKSEKELLEKENRIIQNKMNCSEIWENFNDQFITLQDTKDSNKDPLFPVEDDGSRLSFYSAVSVFNIDNRQNSLGSQELSTCSVDIFQEQESVPLFQQKLFYPNSPLKDSKLIECSPIKIYHQYSTINSNKFLCYKQTGDCNLEQIDFSVSSVKSET